METKKDLRIRLSLTVDNAIEQFLLSREPEATKSTMRWYYKCTRYFSKYCKEHGVVGIQDVTSNTILGYFKAYEHLSDNYRHSLARVVKTLMRYSEEQGFIEVVPRFKMPKVRKKRQCTLSIEEVNKVLDLGCDSIRDQALILLAVDSGLRLSEIIGLRWADLDVKQGIIHVDRTKGGNYRPVAAGRNTIKAISLYQIELRNTDEERAEPGQPMFQPQNGGEMAPMGLRSVFLRISRRSGVYFTAHALRRTFAKLCVKSGMDILFIQQLMGHANLDTTRRYIQDLDPSDIALVHSQHGPIDHAVLKGKKRRFK